MIVITVIIMNWTTNFFKGRSKISKKIQHFDIKLFGNLKRIYIIENEPVTAHPRHLGRYWSLLYLQEIMDLPSTRNNGVKLEIVTIPKFNGDYFKWVTFMFMSLVVNNKTLSKAQQLQMCRC